MMFFLFGFGTQQKNLFSQQGICKHCGHMCRFEIFMTYQYFSLFFITLFKWGKQYYAKSSCCGAIYNIPKELGDDILKSQAQHIPDEYMEYISYSSDNNYCGHCGAPRNGNEYCTKCGNKF